MKFGDILLHYFILAPLISQIIGGTLSLIKKIKFSLKRILFFNIVSFVILSIIFFLNEAYHIKGCLNPLIGIVVLIVFLLILLLIIALVQIIIFKSIAWIKKTKNPNYIIIIQIQEK